MAFTTPGRVVPGEDQPRSDQRGQPPPIGRTVSAELLGTLVQALLIALPFSFVPKQEAHTLHRYAVRLAIATAFCAALFVALLTVVSRLHAWMVAFGLWSAVAVAQYVIWWLRARDMVFLGAAFAVLGSALWFLALAPGTHGGQAATAKIAVMGTGAALFVVGSTVAARAGRIHATDGSRRQ